MPAKKKGKGKGGRKKTPKPKPLPEVPQDQIDPKDTAQYYLDTIKDLNHRIRRYQQKQEDLERQNIDIRVQQQGLDDSAYDTADTEFKDEYKQMQEDREYKAIKKELESQSADLNDRKEREVGETQAKDAQKAKYEEELRKIKTDFQETKDGLTGRRIVLVRRLNELEHFKQERDDLLEKTALMEETLKQRDAVHAQTLLEIAEKEKLDNERLKKNMVDHLSKVGITFRKDSQDFMPETTKRAIKENAIIADQMGKMSDRMDDLAAENEALRQRCQAQTRQIKEMEVNEKVLAKDSYSSGKIVTMLTHKCDEQDNVIEDLAAREDRFEDLEDHVGAFKADVESTKKLNAKHRMQVKEKKLEKASLTHQLEELNEDVSNYENTIQSCAKSLQGLAAVPTELKSDRELSSENQQVLQTIVDTIERALDPEQVATTDKEQEPEEKDTFSPLEPSLGDLLWSRRQHQLPASHEDQKQSTATQTSDYPTSIKVCPR